jgi:hypothetical protein
MLGDRLNCPHPAELAVLIEVPGPAATFRDLHAPMIVIRRDCECKCDGSVSFVPFDHAVIEARLQIGPACCDLMQIHVDHGLHG